MPYMEPDPEDPNVLVGVLLPASRESVRAMAAAFAEEFAALGFDESRLMHLFRSPFYAGAHRALQVLGEDEIRRVVADSLRAWGGCRVVIRDSEETTCQK